ncbi:MAG: hypothetical protein J6X01_00530, partial [Bacteroidales bacterium]|nr:hypothetical protein [Bacteroidales bacterium]
RYYVTNAHLNDTLGHYTTTDQIDTLLGDYATKEALRDSTHMVMDTLHRYYVTNAHLKDTLGHYTTTDQIDTLLGDYATKEALRDSTHMVMDTLHRYYVTNAHLNDTLGHYTTTDQIDTLLGDYATKEALRDSIQKVNNRLTNDSTALAHRMDTLLKHVCDSIKPCVTGWMNDTLKAYTTTNKIDTLIQKYGFATTAQLNDTLSRYTTTNKIDTLLGDYATKEALRDSIQKVNTRLTTDSTILAERIHADSVDLAKHISDTATVIRRSLGDTISHYIGKANLVIKQGSELLGVFNANQVGDTVTVVIPTPSAAQVQSDWEENDDNSPSYIQNKPDLDEYATKDALRDSTRMVFDSLHKYYATKDTIHDGQLHVITYGVNKLDTAKLFSANQLNNDTLNLSRYALLDTLESFYATTKALTDSLDSLRKDIRKVDNTLMPKECSLKIYMGHDHPVNDSTFTLTSEPHSAYLVKIYINGVLVGDNDLNDGYSNNGDHAVLKFEDEGNKRKVTYRSHYNEGYKLEEGDKVILYWFSSSTTEP